MGKPAWSFSSLKTFDQCPKKYYHLRVAKDYKESDSAAMCGFFDEGVWWRGVSDLTIINKKTGVAKVIDYKTGKSAKYADKGQLELMAMATFKHFPDIKTVKGGLLFVVCNAFIKDTYTIEQESELWKKWLMEYGKLEASYDTEVWNPRPSGLCRAHCVVTECPHNGRR